jgi:hypothetical protein
MNPQDHLPTLHEAAVQMLPGFRQARAQLDIAVHVLEYFERHAQYELSTGKYAAFDLADPSLLASIDELKSMLNAFCRIHERLA